MAIAAGPGERQKAALLTPCRGPCAGFSAFRRPRQYKKCSERCPDRKGSCSTVALHASNHPRSHKGAHQNGQQGARAFGSDAAAANFTFPFTLQQLIVLRTLAMSQTLDEAAAALSMSETNVRTTLSKLEKDLDVELFQAQDGSKAWAARGILTDAGHLLLRYTERLLALSTDAITATRDVQDVRTGSIYLAASQTTGVYLLPKLIERYKKSHPEVLVHLQVENTRRCCAAVARGEVNIAIVGGEIPRELEHLIQVRPYQEDEVVLVVSAQHRFASRTHIDKDELLGLSFVSLHRSSTVQGIKNTLVGQGVDWRALKVVMEVNSVEAIKSAVEANLGAAFVSAAAVDKERQLGTLAILRIQNIPLSRTLYCVTDPTRYCSKAAMALIREMFGLSVTLVPQGCMLPYEEDPAYQPLAASATVHGDVLSHAHASNGHVEQSRDSPSSSFPSLDIATGFDVSYEPIMGQRGGPCGLTATASDKIPFTLSQLVVFRTVAVTGSGSAAALALSVSQPAISKSLSLLEQAFGGPLTVRRNGPPSNGSSSSGHTWLTEAGQALLPLCNNILAVAGETIRAVADLRAAHTGRVMLAASQTVGTYVMPRLLAAFRLRNPGVAVHLMVEQSRKACSAVANGEADCAIIGGDVPDELAHVLKVTPYASDELVLIVPRHHELAKKSSIELGELQNLPLVSLNQGSSVQVVQEKILRQHGIKWRQLRVTMEFNSVEAIKGAVQYGLGAAFVSSAAIAKELDLGLFKRIDISGVRLSRTLSLVSSPTREPSFAAQKFMLDVFLAMPGIRAAGDGLPVLFRNAAAVARPWEVRRDGTSSLQPGSGPLP